MSPEATPASHREAVGIFKNQSAFETAVEALMAGGFTRADLSVLAGHDSIDAAGGPATSWKDALSALVGEVKYEGPLVASGAILLVGGATAAAIATIIGAATATAAASEFLGEVTAKPHTEDFTRAVEAGSIILWVMAETPDREAEAQRILVDNGAENVHIHERASAPG